MKARCPYCGYEEDVADDNYGSTVECPCGHSFVVGQVQVSEAAFENGNAVVRCPYCETENSLPKEAIGRNLRCGVCDGKFHTEMRRSINEINADKEIAKINSIQSDQKSNGANRPQKRELLIGIIVFECMAIGLLGCLYLHILYSQPRSSISEHASDFPVYDSIRFIEGELFRINGSCFRIISVIDGGLFRQNGVLFQRHMYGSDFDAPVYYVGGINISNISDGDSMPDICVRMRGTYTYTSASGRHRTVKAFSYVP